MLERYPINETGKEAKLVLEEILKRMDLEAEVSFEENEDRIALTISGKDAAILAGNKGEILDAMQYLLARILRKEDEEGKPIVIDSDGYRQRRKEALIQLAEQLGKKAIRTKKIVAVNPMSAHDRRIIHMALKDTPGITTRSEGEGLNRRLLIVPSSGF